MNNKTIIYYTSNRENPDFEARVRENLLKVCGRVPIISVSQKPINLGTNICVGDVGSSNFNMFRQIQIALKKVKTKFVISAEADGLYPPDYFTFIPARDDVCYRSSELYIVYRGGNYFYHKWNYRTNSGGSTVAQIVGREFYLNVLNKLFEGAPDWSVEEKSFPKERHRHRDIFNEILFFKSTNPCVSFKTGQGMRWSTRTSANPIDKIPYWGLPKDIQKQYL